LTSEEQLENYTESYSKGANTSASKFSLWPNEFKSGDLAAGEQTKEEYAKENYFSNLRK
jgi:hypothetical protein